MSETGRFEKLWDKWKPKQRTDCLNIEVGAMEFGKVVAPFTLLLSSIILSFLIFLCEMTYKKLFKSNKYIIEPASIS